MPTPRRPGSQGRRNADALAAVRERNDPGYPYRHYRCVDRYAPGCESGLVRSVVDRTRDTSAQAWPQHLQTALARSLGARRLVRAR